MDRLVHAHLLIGEEQKKQLRVWAADRDTSMALLVREAIDYYLRVAAGPSPAKVRSAARDAAGTLPLEAPPDGGDPSGSQDERWWGGGG